MSIRHLAAGLLLAACLATPAWAQDETPDPVDLVATIFVGFADGATVEVMGGETAVVERTGPGLYRGAGGGGEFTFTASEVGDCVYQGEFTFNEQSFAVVFDMAQIESIAFENPEPADGFTTYRVQLTGADTAVQIAAADGSLSNAGLSSPITTSVPLADLDAAAAALLELCSGE